MDRIQMTVAAMLMGAALVAASPAQSDTADGKTLAFDVVSIRENKTGGFTFSPVMGPTADGYRVTNLPLTLPILTAYVPTVGGATFFSKDTVLGLPDWVNSDRYDVNAKISDADRERWQKPAEQPAMLRAMLQAALAERCKLAVHRETKEDSVMFLELAKGGPKFKATDPAAEHPGGIKLPFGGMMVPSSDGMTLYGASMTSVATLLSTMSNGGATVVDRTGLTGSYDIVIKRPERPMADATAGSPNMVTATDPSSSLMALDALGLKLRPGKSVVERLVIDHIERPSAN
jgi:uncharacterized protein (TIGR03435 family)